MHARGQLFLSCHNWSVSVTLNLPTSFCFSVTRWLVSLFLLNVYSSICALESIFTRTLILQIAFFFAFLRIIKFSATASFLLAFRRSLILLNFKKHTQKTPSLSLSCPSYSSIFSLFAANFSERFIYIHCLCFLNWLQAGLRPPVYGNSSD